MTRLPRTGSVLLPSSEHTMAVDRYIESRRNNKANGATFNPNTERYRAMVERAHAERNQKLLQEEYERQEQLEHRRSEELKQVFEQKAVIQYVDYPTLPFASALWAFDPFYRRAQW